MWKNARMFYLNYHLSNPIFCYFKKLLANPNEIKIRSFLPRCLDTYVTLPASGSSGGLLTASKSSTLPITLDSTRTARTYPSNPSPTPHRYWSPTFTPQRPGMKRRIFLLNWCV